MEILEQFLINLHKHSQLNSKREDKGTTYTNNTRVM